jgi:hypothetical protein
MYKALPAKLSPTALIPLCRFRISTSKKENGFVAQENCFVARVRTKQNQKSNDFNYLYRQPNRSDRSLTDESPHSSAKAVEFDEPNLTCADCPDGRNCCWIAPRHSISTGGTGRGQWQLRSGKTTHDSPSAWTDDPTCNPVRPLSRNGNRRQDSGKGRQARYLRGDVGAAWSGLPKR